MKMKVELNFIDVTNDTIKDLTEDTFVVFVVEEEVMGITLKYMHAGFYDIDMKRFRYEAEDFDPSDVLKYAVFEPTIL